MSTYPKLNIEPELSNIKTREDDIKIWNIKLKTMVMKIYWRALKFIMNLIKSSIKVYIKRKYY